jgi:hypothetical protein
MMSDLIGAPMGVRPPSCKAQAEVSISTTRAVVMISDTAT